jgi:hypothetical protein
LYIYRRWLIGAGPEPLRTIDVDLASPDPLSNEVKPLVQCLEEAGFRSQPFALSLSPPAQRFVHDIHAEIEFITPMVGNATPPTVEIQKGLIAQSLRYVELLFQAPIEVVLTPSDLTPRVASPGSYFMQKALSFPARSQRQNKAKDLAYLFELLHNYSELSTRLKDDIEGVSRARPEWRRWRERMVDNLDRYFADLDSEGVFLVAEQEPHPYAEYVQSGGEEGIEEFKGLVFRTFRDAVGRLRRGGHPPPGM